MKIQTLFVCLLCLYASGCSPIDPVKAREKLQRTTREYMSHNAREDSWWLQYADDPTPELVTSLERASENIHNALKRSARVSPLATEIASTFDSFFPSLYQRGKVIAFEAGEDSPTRRKTSQEVCFIPRNEFARTGGTPLHYRYDWRTVMMAGVSWPDPFFAALTMHELGHNFRHKKGIAPVMFSPEWLHEEVTMHELEADVLDHLTGRKYGQAIHDIVKKYPKARSVFELMAQISSSDLIGLDDLVGVSRSGHVVRGIACAEHIAMIGFRYIDQHGGGSQEKSAYYKWIIRK